MRRVRILGVLALASLLAGCVGGEPPTAPIVDETPESLEVPQESPEPEPAPVVSEAFTTPWPSGFTRRELADSALAKTYEFLERRERGSGDSYMTLIYQDSVLDIHRLWAEDLASLTADAFSGMIEDHVLLVFGTESDFFVETLEARGETLMPGFDRCCSRGNVGVAFQGIAWMSFPQDFITEAIPTMNHISATPHELFHIVQDSLDEGPGGQVLPPGNPFYRPVWLVEGSAQFMGEALVAYRGYRPYWGNHFTATARGAAGEDLILSRHEIYVGSVAPYDYGSLATEYIIASVGVDALMNIWKIAGQGASFEDAFEEALGISVPDFYTAYDAMVDGMLVG